MEPPEEQFLLEQIFYLIYLVMEILLKLVGPSPDEGGSVGP